MTAVIVGAGQAGAQTAASLRREGYAERIVLVGAEAELPYQRPPLSKSFLVSDEGSAPLRAQSFYADNAIELLTGHRIIAIDREARIVGFDDGRELRWDHLVLATGARPRPLGIPGEQLAGVCTLRDLADAREIRSRMTGAESIVIIGGGFIGLELATAFAAHAEVVVFEATDRLMGRVVTADMSEFFGRAHQERGVDLRFAHVAEEFVGEDGRVTGVRTPEGRVFPADLVVIGAGVLPRDELARDCGLAVDNGILVDGTLRTADPAVSAIGDCARFPSAHSGSVVRLESVQNAVDQAQHVAEQIATGTVDEYRSLPWFWSHQDELKLQIAGLAAGHDRTHLIGEPDEGKFSVLAFRQDRLVAVESVNRPADHMAARRLLAAGHVLRLDEATVPGFDLRAFQRLASRG
ncbi:FAD-dependent oxidoreductase [Saccharopolyspora sp. K220]|uniref:NAD(P)/FAD-dependent oxidoreductase n=1 Tax=Saccharopolyspora soli TaxID=2926618 RepID=UPI001F55AAA0|nr:FAD-dependent oxidoreductase [Saccharopolyspora soli]MCI2418854.1 FAD-dependent oxidoreductase [Saccharopolyspora soli]